MDCIQELNNSILFSLVIDKNKYNIIDKKGNLIFKKWYDFIDVWGEGIVLLKDADRCNIVFSDGHLLREDMWFKSILAYKEGYFVVKRLEDDMFNFIDMNGTFLSDRWYFDCMSFSNGFASVRMEEDENSWNIIDKSGTLLCKNSNFSSCSSFVNGTSIVSYGPDGIYSNLIDTNGNILFPDKKYYYIEHFFEGFAVVGVFSDNIWGKTSNYIDKDGNYLSSQYFDRCYHFKDGNGQVLIGTKQNFIDKNGNLLLKENADYLYRVVKNDIDIPDSHSCFIDSFIDQLQISNNMRRDLGTNFTEKIKAMKTDEFNNLLEDPTIKQMHNVGPDAEEYMKKL